VTTPDTRLRTYLKAFWNDWLSRMCGPLSVPLGAMAVFWTQAPVKTLWAVLAVVAFFVASYRVWRNERNIRLVEGEKHQQAAQVEIAVLEEENARLRRKPYDEELGRQAAALLGRLSPEGKTLLRHLVTHEPIECGRRFRPEIAQDVQDAQVAIAYGSGIVRHQEFRLGNGNLLRTDYVVNPQFRPVLQDLLYDR
jgi:hypothetical protein